MVRNLTTLFGSVMATVMLVSAMWIWTRAFRLSDGTTRPDVTLWAVRSGAVALIAGAQAILMTFVVCVVYRRDLVWDVLRFGAGLVAAIAMISAIALGLAGR